MAGCRCAGGSVAVEAEKVVWTKQAAAILAPALGDALPIVEAEVKAGDCELWQYPDDSFTVTRLEVTAAGRELVLVAGAGRCYKEKVAGWVRLAKEKGWSVRVHSNRSGVGRWRKGLGFQQVETVYRC